MKQALHGEQSGAVLLIALVMLLLLGLLATANMSSNNMTMLLIKNQQQALKMEQAASAAVNYVLSDRDYFIRHESYRVGGKINIELPADLLAQIPDSPSIEVTSLDCLIETRSKGCSLDEAASCDATYYWQLVVTASDQRSEAVFVQGLSLDYLPGYCP